MGWGCGVTFCWVWGLGGGGGVNKRPGRVQMNPNTRQEGISGLVCSHSPSFPPVLVPLLLREDRRHPVPTHTDNTQLLFSPALLHLKVGKTRNTGLIFPDLTVNPVPPPPEATSTFVTWTKSTGLSLRLFKSFNVTSDSKR